MASETYIQLAIKNLNYADANFIRTRHHGNFISQKNIQTKLTINNPDDRYEKEADAVAEKVMRMENPGIQTKTNTNLFFKPAPITINPIQRKCSHCEEEEKSIQRKEMNGEETSANDSLESYIGSLNSRGEPLPTEVRNFYEPRFGYDFSNVKLHTDSIAAKSAQSVNALAYTSGNNILFNSGQYSPNTDSGKKLLVHELTHVMQQQMEVNNSIQRKNAEPVNIEQQEQKLKNDFNAIRKATDAASSSDTKAKIKIKQMVLAFKNDFAAYKPSFKRQWVEYEYVTEEYWRYSNVYSKPDAIQLAARLLLIGLPQESDIMYQFGKPTSTVGVWPLDQPDQFHKAYTQASLERIDVSTHAKADASLDILLASFKFMINEIKKPDMAKVQKDKQYASFYGPAEKVMEFGFLGDWPYYTSLIAHLGKLYGGMQRVIENKMETVYAELNATGETATLAEVFSILKKIEAGVPATVKFLKPATGAEVFDPSKATVAITHTEFTQKGGQHKDYFDNSAKAPSVKIEYYDKDQKEGVEKFLPIAELHKIRYNQLAFIQSFYGIDKNGKKIADKKGPADLMPGTKHFSLFSLDDWKVFLDAKYVDLINAGANSADAFLTIIGLLESYMKAFTIHTPFNIEDKGDNYLTKTFPKGLSGQLIHDCGVYALKTVYLLSLLATKLHLKIQYIMLPNHVGLIIRGDNTPVIFVHNNEFTPVPVSESQFDSLSNENQRMILTDKAIANYQQARKKGDTSEFVFTIDKLKQDWLDFSKDKKIPGAKTDKQFLGEIAAGYFVNQVDMPFAIIDVNAKDYNPKVTNDKIKKNLWAQYQAMVRNTVFFDKKAMEKEFSPTYQFNLRYLELTVATKNFHNNTLLPFWNVEARSKWKTLSKNLDGSLKANDKKAYLAFLQAYRDGFVAGANKVEDAFNPIRKEKESIHETVTTDPLPPIRKSVERTVGKRSGGEIWHIAFETHLAAVDKRIKNLTNGTETLSTGTDFTPAFATEGDMLQYYP